jgi:hypothetical protein
MEAQMNVLRSLRARLTELRYWAIAYALIVAAELAANSMHRNSL